MVPGCRGSMLDPEGDQHQARRARRGPPRVRSRARGVSPADHGIDDALVTNRATRSATPRKRERRSPRAPEGDEYVAQDFSPALTYGQYDSGRTCIRPGSARLEPG